MANLRVPTIYPTTSPAASESVSKHPTTFPGFCAGQMNDQLDDLEINTLADQGGVILELRKRQ